MSIHIDPSEWRLSTDGGIPYKLVEGFPSGSFEAENAEAEEQYIIRASDLSAFVLESFPAHDVVGGDSFFFQPRRAFPSLSTLRTRRVSYKPLEQGKPTDPYGIDPDASDETYADFLSVTINYFTDKGENVDPNNPFTFLEIAADASGEFLMLPVRSGESEWQDPEIPAEPDFDVNVKGLNAPISQLIPEIEWTVTWSQIDNLFFSILLPIMRSNLGKVNLTPMPLLYFAPSQTLLFVGFSMRQQESWRGGLGGIPPVQIEMKFIEKHIDIGGEIVGHNHFWREEEGRFVELNIRDGEPVYRKANLNAMFPIAVE